LGAFLGRTAISSGIFAGLSTLFLRFAPPEKSQI
jgi:hypothetical protein